MALVFETAKGAVVDCRPSGTAVRDDISHGIFLREGRIPNLHQFTMKREKEKEKEYRILVFCVIFARYFTIFSQFRFHQRIKLLESKNDSLI